jgi:hypothetical protein
MKFTQTFLKNIPVGSRDEDPKLEELKNEPHIYHYF